MGVCIGWTFNEYPAIANTFLLEAMLIDTMKLTALIFYSIFLVSCTENEKKQGREMQKPDKESYATELINSDFLKYADSSNVDNLKVQLRNSFDIYDAGNFKIAHIDAEELSEFSFDFFLSGLNTILAKRDIQLSVQKLSEKENSFDILINGDRMQLYDQKSLDNETFWDAASRNFFRKVNEILNTRNTDEKFYLLYGGNDLHAILLTEKQLSIISEYYKGEPREIPYKP